MTRDLTFLWEEATHETLDENKQKVREAGRRAILDWATSPGRGDRLHRQRADPAVQPAGPLLRGAQPAPQRRARPAPRRASPTSNWLMVHNIDTLGATLDPGVLGLAIESAATLSFEVIPRRIDDRGGGLARVGGRLRLLEGLAQPREDTEFALRYYNTLTTWVEIDGLLDAFAAHPRRPRARPGRRSPPPSARMAARVPTYVTIKDVKRRWGHGQEDVFPVAQFEKLWGDLTSLARPALRVPRRQPAARAAAQGRRPARRLGQRRQPRLRRIALCTFSS